MTEKTLTTENIKPALDALRGELAPWPVVAKKQDRLNTAQLNAANSGITSSLVAQIIANTAAIRALESAITGTGLRALVVASLPAIGTQGILYIVPVTTYDPATDADVVNYSNEYIWIPVEGGTASEGHYEQVGQTGIVINNGQLTITVNGTSVGTFTANQSGDTTAAITVPTNADYVDRTTDQTVAGVKTFSSTINGTASKAIADEDGTSIKTGYGKLVGNQTWNGIQTYYDSSKLVFQHTRYASGTTPATDIFWQALIYGTSGSAYCASYNVAVRSSGVSDLSFRLYSQTSNTLTGFVHETNADASDISFRPIANGTHNLGSSSYQWSSVYAQSYYYNGTAWGLDKANTWTGDNTYTKYQNIIIAGTEIGVAPNNQNRNGLLFKDKNNETLGWVRSVYDSTGDLSIEMLITNKYSNGALDPNGTQTYQGIKQTLSASGDVYFGWGGRVNNSVVPKTNNYYDLGTSTNKWKSLNGVNPGALSLPDLNNTVDITSTFNTAIDKTQTVNSYTADLTGWLFINWWTEGLTNPFYVYVYCTNSATDNNLLNAVWGQSFSVSGNVDYMLTQFPVISGKTYWFVTNFSRASTDTKNLAYSVRKLPCLGNV